MVTCPLEIRRRAPRTHAIGIAAAIVLVSIALMALLSFNPTITTTTSTKTKTSPRHNSRVSSGKHQEEGEDLKKEDKEEEDEGMPSWKGFRQIANLISGESVVTTEIEGEDINDGGEDKKIRRDQDETDVSSRNRGGAKNKRVRSLNYSNRSVSGKATDRAAFVNSQEERRQIRRDSLYSPVFLPPTPPALALHNNLLLALSFAQQIDVDGDDYLSFDDASEKEARNDVKRDVMTIGSRNDGHYGEGLSTSTVVVYPAVLYIDRRSPSLPLPFTIRVDHDHEDDDNKEEEEEDPPHPQQKQSMIGGAVGGEQCWLRTLLGAVEAEERRENEEEEEKRERAKKSPSSAPAAYHTLPVSSQRISSRREEEEGTDEQNQLTPMSANNTSHHSMMFDLVDRIVCQNDKHRHHNYYSNAANDNSENSDDKNNKNTNELIGTKLIGGTVTGRNKLGGDGGTSMRSSSSRGSSPLPLQPPLRALPSLVSSIVNRLPSRGQYGRYESTSLALYGLPNTPSAQNQHKRLWEALASRLWPMASADAPTSARAQNSIVLGREEGLNSPQPLETNFSSHHGDSLFSLLVGYPPLSASSYPSLREDERAYVSSVLNEFPFLQQLACPPPPPKNYLSLSSSSPLNSLYATVVVRGNAMFIVSRRSGPIVHSLKTANAKYFEKRGKTTASKRGVRPFRPFICASNTIAASPSALGASVSSNLGHQTAEQSIENPLNSAVDKDATPPPGEEGQKKNGNNDEQSTPTVVAVGSPASSASDGDTGGGSNGALDNNNNNNNNDDDFVSAPTPSVLTRITLGTNSDGTRVIENGDRAEIIFAHNNNNKDKDKDLHTSLKQAITRNIRNFRHYFRESFLGAEKWAELKSKRRREAARSGKKEWEKEQEEESIFPLGPLSTPEGPSVLRSTCGAWSEPDATNGGYVRWSPAAGNCSQRLLIGRGVDILEAATELLPTQGSGKVGTEEDEAPDRISGGKTPKNTRTSNKSKRDNSMHLLDDYPNEAYKELLGGLLQSVTGLGLGTRSDRNLWGYAENNNEKNEKMGRDSGGGEANADKGSGSSRGDLEQKENVQRDRHRARLREKIKTSKEGMTAVLADGMRGFIKRKLEAEHLARLRETMKNKMKKEGAGSAKQDEEKVTGAVMKKRGDVESASTSMLDVLHPSESTFNDHQHISFLFWGDSTIRGAFCATFRYLMAYLPSARSRETCDAGGIHGLPHGTRTISAFLPTDTSLYEWRSRQRKESEAPTGDIDNENQETKATKRARAAFSRRILDFFATTPIRLTVTLTFFSSPYFGEELATQTLHSTTGVGFEELLVRYFPPTAVTLLRGDQEAAAHSRSDQPHRRDMGHRNVSSSSSSVQKSSHFSLDDVVVPSASASASTSSSASSFANLVEMQREEIFREMGRGAATGGPPRPIPLPSLVYCGKGMWDGLRVTSGLPDERLYMSSDQLSLGLGLGAHASSDNDDSQDRNAETRSPPRSGATVENNQKHNPSLLEHSLLYERVVAEAFVSLRTLFPYAALTLQGAQHVVPPLLYEKTGFTFCTATFVKGYWRRRLFAAARLFNGFIRWKKMREEEDKEERRMLLKKMKLEPSKATLGPTINDEVNNLNALPLFYVDYDELTSAMGQQFFTRGDGVHLNHPLLDTMIGLTAADVGVQMLQLPPPTVATPIMNLFTKANRKKKDESQWTLQPSGLSPQDLWTLLYQGSDPLLAHRLYVYEPRDGKDAADADEGERRRLLSSHTLKRPRALRRSISLVFLSTDSEDGTAAVKTAKMGEREVENEKSSAVSVLARQQTLIRTIIVRTFPPHLPTSAAHLPYPTPKCTSIAAEYMLGRPGAVKLGLISGYLGIVMSGTIPRAPAPAEAADFELQVLPPSSSLLSSSDDFDTENKPSSSSKRAALIANHYDGYKRQYKSYISDTHIARRWFAAVSSPKPSEHILLITTEMTNETWENPKSYLYVEPSSKTRPREEEPELLYVPNANDASREGEGARKEREGAEKESDQKNKKQNDAARVKDMVKGTTRFAFRSLFDVLSPFEYAEETDEFEEEKVTSVRLRHQTSSLAALFTHRSPAATLQRMWIERAVLAENILEFLVLPAMERFSSAGAGNKVPPNPFPLSSSKPIIIDADKTSDKKKKNVNTNTNVDGPSSVKSNDDDDDNDKRAATRIISSVNAKEEMLACARVNILIISSRSSKSSTSVSLLTTAEDIQFVLEFRDRSRHRKIPHAQATAEEVVCGYLRLCYGRDFQFPERPEDVSAASAMDLPFVDIIIDEQKTAQHVARHVKRSRIRRKGRGRNGDGETNDIIPEQNMTRFIKDLVRPAALRFASQLELSFLTAVAEASVPQFTIGGELARLGAEKLVFTPKAKGTSKKKKGKRGRRR